jgi:broad specificity phosphatase PhoE
MRVFLVRHGQTAWNIGGRAQGHTDIPLDEAGLTQAACLWRAFEGVHIERVLSSDLMRARQTAEGLASVCERPIQYLRELRERSFGDWEGQGFMDVRRWQDEESVRTNTPWTSVRPPNGESLSDVWARTAPVIQRIVEAREHVVLVAHGQTCGVLLAQLLRATVDSARSFRFGNTAIAELELRTEGFFSMNRYNDTSHLVLADAAAQDERRTAASR